MNPGHNSGAGALLAGFLSDIEGLEEQKRAFAEAIKGKKAEARRAGFDSKVINQMLRERRMDAGAHQIEGKHGQRIQEVLDERLATPAYGRAGGTLHAVQQLGGGDGRNGDGLAAVSGQGAVEADSLAFRRDQDRGVDQRAHGDPGIRPWRFTARRTSAA